MPSISSPDRAIVRPPHAVKDVTRASHRSSKFYVIRPSPECRCCRRYVASNRARRRNPSSRVWVLWVDDRPSSTGLAVFAVAAACRGLLVVRCRKSLLWMDGRRIWRLAPLLLFWASSVAAAVGYHRRLCNGGCICGVVVRLETQAPSRVSKDHPHSFCSKLRGMMVVYDYEIRGI